MKRKSNTQTNQARREFIQKTALASGGIITAPFSMDAMVHVHNDKTLKLALVGCGGRGSGAAVQALTADDNVELVAMADAFADRLEDSLRTIQEHFEGEKKIDVKEQNRFTGF